MNLNSTSESKFYLVTTPIGNLEDITLRALRVLREVDIIFCEDTRRSIKLLNHYDIHKPLKSCPYYKERSGLELILKELSQGKSLAYVSDAGVPGISDPGAILVRGVRKAGFPVEVIGGVSAITNFIAGLGEELEDFHFVGFLPEKIGRRKTFLEKSADQNLLFFESTHRIQKTLELMKEVFPERNLNLGKELTKISEAYFEGRPAELLEEIPSWKGEWVGLWWRL